MPRHPRGTSASDRDSARTRRSHRKSRNGCRECKRRHIRCDEGRPACTNCSIAERECSYPPAAVAATAASVASPTHDTHSSLSLPLQQHHHNLRSHPSHSPIPASDRSHVATSAPSRQDHVSSVTPADQLPDPLERTTAGSMSPYPPSSLARGAFLYTSEHLVLLHHAQTHVIETMATAPGNGAILMSVALRHAVVAPYLLDELLAISAVNLALTQPQPSSTSPGSSAEMMSYRHQATELQTRALTSFTRETELLMASNSTVRLDADSVCITRFLFTAMLGIHVLADCLARDPSTDFHAFVDGFVDCILLHHGVRTTVRPNWQALVRSEIRELLTPAIQTFEKERQDPANGKPPDAECAPLEDLLQVSDLGPTSIDACRDAVSALQAAFNMQAAMENPSAPNPSSAFAVTVSADFVNVLRRHRPEALIILAYYGALLHRSRACWVIGDSGARLIRAVSNNLGSLWQDALRWPLEVIATEVDG